MPKYCSACGAKLPEGSTACPACHKTEEGSPVSTASSGLSTHVASALCYIWIAAIAFLLIEPYNKVNDIRFHAYQGLFLAAIWFGGSVALEFIPLLGWMVLPFWSLVMVVISIVCAVKAYQGDRLKLPVISEMAEKQATGK
ncbi:MAG TPA: hypothetical protein VI457_04420 [Methylococcaceae bacterium]|nr:hypothetical protein [Methylococcaceae bacterium]